jgi:hypothetical protein
MNKPFLISLQSVALVMFLCCCAPAQAQFGGGGFGGGFGGRGGGGGVRIPAKLVARYDKDGDGRLNAAERRAALLDILGPNAAAMLDRQPQVLGPKLTPSQVKTYGADVPLYDPNTLRTVFMQFEDPAWETELAVFKRTDVEIPATVMVDGKTYRDVGVRFHGETSFSMVGEGQKRSFNLSFNFVHGSQKLLGHSGVTLLNSAADPTFLRSVLYMQVMRDYLPAPQANYMRVVINGESWGVYVNQQQVDSVFAREAGGATGPRWRIPGNPNGHGDLAYLGDDPAPYKRIYELKNQDKPETWAALIHLCKVIDQTPPDKLKAALEPLLDVDGALRFFAIDNVMQNDDGFWTRASDYNLYIDTKGRFHLTPHDANETWRPLEGGGGGRRRAATPPPDPVALDPLVDQDNPTKVVLVRLLAVPEFREAYLNDVRDVARRWLQWNHVGPIATKYQALIAADVKTDVRKLYSTEAFSSALTVDGPEAQGGGPIAPPDMSLKSFVEQRGAWLAKYFGDQAVAAQPAAARPAPAEPVSGGGAGTRPAGR